MKKLTILVASLGKNVDLGQAIGSKANEMGFTAEVVNLVDLNFPLYSTKQEEAGVPEQAKWLSEKLQQSSGFVLVAPEYNGSIPPVLNNTIAWISRSGDDWREAFNGKRALIATHSGSGGLHALMAMRQQLSYVGANVLGRQLHTHYSKELNAESLESCLKQLL